MTWRILLFALFALIVFPLAAQPSTTTTPPRFEREACIFDAPEPKIICGRLLVPEQRDGDITRLVSIAVAILPARSDTPQPDPVLYLEGGPGFSALYALYALLDHPIREERPIILMDQRGVGFSTPSLNCPEVETNDSGIFLSPLAACRYRLADEEGIDLNAYHSAAVAADIYDLTQALNLDQINLYGVSYGSRLALTVMRDYPQIVRAAVLDAVFPPEVDLIEQRIANRLYAFNALFQACTTDAACNSTYPNLEETFYAVVERYNTDPHIVETPSAFPLVPPVISGYHIVDALFLGMYNTPALPMLPEGIARLNRAENGDDIIYGYYLTRGAITPQIYRRTGDVPNIPTIQQDAGVRAHTAQYGDVFYAEGAYLSVNCPEEINFSDGNAATMADAELVRPLLLDYLSADVSGLLFSCAVWDIPPRPPLETERVYSTVPTLLMGGAYDPITSVSWMLSARNGLPVSTMVVVNNGGHGVSLNTECGAGVVVAYLNAPGSVPDSGCAAQPLTFFTG